MNSTSINWTDYSSNLIRARRLDNGKVGHFCTHKTEKCRNCYAEAINLRFGTGLSYHPANREKIKFFFAQNEAENLKRLQRSLAKKGDTKKVFLSSMTDLYHETMPTELVVEVFCLIQECQNLIFQILTKRIDVALLFYSLFPEFGELQNVWFGLTPKDDGSDIPQLLGIPVAVKWLSIEPVLKEVDLTPHLERLSWVVVGGESGPKARATNIEHIRSVVRQCRRANVAVWVKQLGKKPFVDKKDWSFSNAPINFNENKTYLILSDRKGERIEEFPEDLRVREFPQ